MSEAIRLSAEALAEYRADARRVQSAPYLGMHSMPMARLAEQRTRIRVLLDYLGALPPDVLDVTATVTVGGARRELERQMDGTLQGAHKMGRRMAAVVLELCDVYERVS